MLAKESRLTESTDFERVKSKGSTVRSHSFTMGYYDRGDASPSRFGFVIPASWCKNATDRNRIKRVLSESTRHEMIFVKNGFDVVYIPNQSILRTYTHDAVSEIKAAFTKADMYK